jgi:Uma2 family endonuclease
MSDVSFADYLSNPGEPECDYVDGLLVDRHAGEPTHGRGIATTCFLLAKFKSLTVLTILTLKISDTRYRVVDVCAYAGDVPDDERYPSKPPFICVEVLSPGDGLSYMVEKLTDYLKMGVPNVWVIDPYQQWAASFDSTGLHFAHEVLSTRNPDVALPLAAVFDDLA